MNAPRSISLGLIAAVAVALVHSLSGQVAAEKSAGPESEVLQLSVFEVKESSRDYIENNTNSVTGTNMALNKLPISADVFNQTLIRDLGATDASQVLAELAGFGLGRIGAGENATGMLRGDPANFNSFTGRGLPVSNQRREGFLLSPTTQLDTFDIDRIETVRGSQSLLYGAGDAGGVINYQSKRAIFKRNSLSISLKVDDQQSARETIDVNAGTSNFALLVAAVHDATNLWRDNLGTETEGLFVSAGWRPAKWITIRAEQRKLSRVDALADSFNNYAGPTGDPRNGSYPALLLGNGTSGPLADPTNAARVFPALLNDNLSWENVDSLLGNVRSRDLQHTYRTAWVDLNPNSFLSMEFRYGFDKRINHELTAAARGALTAPGVGLNPFADQWAATYAPQASWVYTDQKGYRATASLNFPLLKVTSNQLNFSYESKEAWTKQIAERFYRTDAAGNTIVTLSPITAANPTGLNNANAGRTPIAAAWVPIDGSNPAVEFPWPRDTMQWFDGQTYRLENIQIPGAGIVSATNPYGVNGTPAGTYSFQSSIERAFTGTLYSDIFNDRINVMAGVRSEEFTLIRATLGDQRGPARRTSFTAGTLLRIVDGVKLYVARSTNAKINIANDVPDIWGNPLGARGEGVTDEVGVKFDLLGRRLSGSATVFRSKAKNEFATLDAATRNLVDPAGINGRNSTGAGFLYDRESTGGEISLSFNPKPNWTVLFRYTHSDGTEGSDVSLPTFYNDQFNTVTINGQLAAAVDNSGTISPLMVRSNPRDSNSALVPLTIAMMKDSSSPYFAVLDPTSGQIINAADLGLAQAGTGRTGLPITDHQLGFVSPTGGSIVVRKGGDKTTGYAVDYFSLVTNYRFTSDRLRGWAVGSSFSLSLNQRAYYYTSATNFQDRRLFEMPDRFNWNAFVKYERPLGRRVKWRAQLNVNNVIGDMDVVVLPSSTTGLPRNARVTAAPRSYSLSSSFTW